MGYSIALRVRNVTLRKKMLAFMGKHYRKWSDVIGKGKSISAGNPTDDLSYDHAKRALGLDYASGCGGWERAYVFSVTRWMAIKVGERRYSFSKDDGTKTKFASKVPYIVYDGYESWPILIVKNVEEIEGIPESWRWCAMDKYGVYIWAKAHESVVTAALDAMLGDTVWKALSRDLAKLGHRPDDPKKHKAWLEKHKAVKAKHAAPEIKRVMPKLRAELAMLDKLWSLRS